MSLSLAERPWYRLFTIVPVAPHLVISEGSRYGRYTIRGFLALSPNSRVWGEIPGPLLTIAQVAVILQIREKLVRNHIKEKRLKAVKIGKYWRIKSEYFSDFIEGKTRNGMPESMVPSQEVGDGPDLTPDAESL